MNRGLRRTLTAAVAACFLAKAAAAQGDSIAIVLAGGDARSWEPYFDLGVQKFRKLPGEAATAFAMATRLDPSRAEPLFGLWATALMYLDAKQVNGYLRASVSSASARTSSARTRISVGPSTGTPSSTAGW